MTPTQESHCDGPATGNGGTRGAPRPACSPRRRPSGLALVVYVDLPAGYECLENYISALMTLFNTHSTTIETLLANIGAAVVSLRGSGCLLRVYSAHCRVPTLSAGSVCSVRLVGILSCVNAWKVAVCLSIWLAILLCFCLVSVDRSHAVCPSVVEFHSAALWERLPPGWGDALTALELEELVCLASPEVPLPRAAMAEWPAELVNYVEEALRLALPRHRCKREPTTDGDASASLATRPGGRSGGGGGGGRAATAAVQPSAACPFIPTEDELRSSGVEVAPAHSAQRQLLRHIKPKKRHELQRLSSVISDACKHNMRPPERERDQTPTVVDIGCGQGYLARMLTYMHGLDVVGVEAAQSNTDTAAEKASKLRYEVEKKAKASDDDEAGEVGRVGQLRFLNRLVCSERDIGAVVDEVATDDFAAASTVVPDVAENATVCALGTGHNEGERPRRDSVEPLPKKQRPAQTSGTGDDVGSTCRRCSIVGLHACGILTPQILRAYATCTTVSSVVAVGCCYHKGGGGSLPLPAVLEEWGPDRQSWKGDGAASVSPSDPDTATASAATAAITESFPMSTAIKTRLQVDAAESGQAERAAVPGTGVGRWLGSAQSRELACHALEQYTRRPWRQSALLAKTMDGMYAGKDMPSLVALRESCTADTAYLRHQCYRSVLEVELRHLGVSPRVAVGSVKRMERLSFGEYAQKAVQKLQKAKVLREQQQFVLSRDYAAVRSAT